MLIVLPLYLAHDASCIMLNIDWMPLKSPVRSRGDAQVGGLGLQKLKQSADIVYKF